MATGWVKSLQCKSRAFEDVILPNSGCTKSFSYVKDVVQGKPKRRHHRPPPPPTPRRSSHRPKNVSPSAGSGFFPTLKELPEGHSSRNVVEIIFRTSWSEKSFPGRIELIFKVQNPAATVARFEEYRDAVRARAGAAALGSRCVADGNEVMRFHCVGAALGGAGEASGLCAFSGKETAVRTFAGSGGAHENAGSGRGRRAMLVCRVIAGRVCGGVESFLEGRSSEGFDSVSNDDDSLIVFDSRALLPCFLIIYRL